MTKTMTKLLIVALMAGSALASATETPIRVTMEDGATVAQFRLGELDCVLENGQIRCTPGK
jgi:hypothetical protein